ncbi:hypothetical protein [Companilactobacillus nuruki]|uniref:hypothetical protein n=1 Tax=Companilactobacillus nuruki TaxID=1993540 RepID=UPI001416EDE8|nr:hypothetical protein [Companilactobacillus nuruki]
MAEKISDSKEKIIDSSNLSRRSQNKLEEIKQKHGFKTTEEAINYLTSFFEKSN